MISTFLNWSLHILLLSAAIYLIYLGLRRLNFRSSNRYLFLKIAFLTLPFQAMLFQVEFPSLVNTEPKIIQAQSSVNFELPPINIVRESPSNSQHFADLWSSIGNVLFIIFLLGLIFSLSKVIHSYWTLSKLRKAAKPLVVDESVIYFHEEELSPAVFGILNPSVLIPKRLVVELSDHELEMVVSHENEHIKRYDPLFNCARHVVRAFVFFSPFAKALSYSFEEEMELSLDESLIEKGIVLKKDYGSLLIDLCSLDLVTDSVVCNGLSQKLLQRRMLGMKNLEKMNYSQKVVLGALVVVALIGISVPIFGIKFKMGFAESSLDSRKVNLDYFLVNLSGNDGSRLFKAEMDFEVENPLVKKEVEQRMSQVRDNIIILLSKREYKELATPEGKEKIKVDIRDTVNSFLEKGKVKKVYFTRFIYN